MSCGTASGAARAYSFRNSRYSSVSSLVGAWRARVLHNVPMKGVPSSEKAYQVKPPLLESRHITSRSGSSTRPHNSPGLFLWPLFTSWWLRHKSQMNSLGLFFKWGHCESLKKSSTHWISMVCMSLVRKCWRGSP